MNKMFMARGEFMNLYLSFKRRFLAKSLKKKLSQKTRQWKERLHFKLNKLYSVTYKFWKNIAFSPPLYGADNAVTIMNTKSPWNLSHINSTLSKGIVRNISGVNQPYTYFGSWKSFFAWHKEDMDLYGINYLHYGKPKLWYCLAPDQEIAFEEYSRKLFPDNYYKCPEFMRHKTSLINPYLAIKNIPSLKICKAEQNQNEFICVFGKAYHMGFNFGFNIAEAVNYATPKWIEYL